MVERIDYLGPYPLDLTEALFNGVARSIQAIYKWGNPKPEPLGVVAVSNFDATMVKANEKWGQATPKNLLAVRLATMQENYNGYNPSAMLRTGWLAGFTPNGTERIIFHLTPVIVTFEIRFYTDQMAALNNYIRNWLHRFRYESGFDIDVENPNFTFHINVQGNDSFTYPMNDRSEDASMFVDMECRAFSYIGHYEAVPVVQRINWGVVVDPNNTNLAQNNLPNQFTTLLDAQLDADSVGESSINNYVKDYMSAWTITLTGQNPELDTPDELAAAQEAFLKISAGEISSLALSGLGTLTSLTPGR